jgi:feruloyl esterase
MVSHSGQAVEISARSKKRSLQVARMVAAAVVCYSATGFSAAHADESQQASNCSALQQTNINDTRIESAQVLPAGSVFKDPDGKPVTTSVKVCRVVATVSTEPTEQVGIEVWLPLDGWNGRLLGVGSGGFGGSIVYSELAPAI